MLTIMNLVLQEKLKGQTRKYFQYKEEICNFMDRNWDSLCSGKSSTNILSSLNTVRNQNLGKYSRKYYEY